MKRWIKIQIFYWMPVYLYMGLIFYLSSLSYVPTVEPRIISGFIVPNYLKHVFEYLFLGFLLVRASKRSGFRNYFLVSIIILGLYALSDEIHQFFVVGREFDLSDLFFDIVGGFIGIFLIKLRKIKWRKIKENFIY